MFSHLLLNSQSTFWACEKITWFWKLIRLVRAFWKLRSWLSTFWKENYMCISPQSSACFLVTCFRSSENMNSCSINMLRFQNHQVGQVLGSVNKKTEFIFKNPRGNKSQISLRRKKKRISGWKKTEEKGVKTKKLGKFYLLGIFILPSLNNRSTLESKILSPTI